eukprot:TRINITY_DN3401_c0_g2_i2.p1 TRINITY_DN3401_c0_g2~~TRINITY_DN3401_c0_g2_i2.p1  ORF type:complete len:607 (-),score=121.87 TRINITY_DN3401_c0_g2_i2:170-1990(-)
MAQTSLCGASCMVMTAMLSGLLLAHSSKSRMEEMDQTEETSFLAQPPITASTTTAPDVASALAALKAAQQQAQQFSQKAPLPPPAESSLVAPAPAAARNVADGKESSGSVLPESPAAASTASAMTSTESAAATVAPPAARGLAADLMALLAGAKLKPVDENQSNQSNQSNHSDQTAAQKNLPTVKLTKQYVPIDKNGVVIAYKTAYFGKVHVGSPQPQDFTVVFDTGSAHLVLPSSACESETCKLHRSFNETTSESCYPIEHDGTPLPRGEASSHSVSITFGTGKVSGTFVRDQACLGGSLQSDGKDGCTFMNVVVAKEMSDQPFSLFHFDGILGLGLEALALGPGYSFFGQMVAQHPAMQPRFSVFLARTDQGESSISFGGHDETKAASDVHWVPVAMPELGYWQVQIQSVRMGDVVLDDCADGGCRAILDTGTSLLGAPRQAIKSLHQHLSRDVLLAPQGTGFGEDQVSPEAGKEAASKDCRLLGNGAPLTFDLGPGIPGIVMEAEDYFRPKPFNMTVPGKPGAWKLSCRSLLLPLDLEAPLGPRTFILGEPVLRKYYTIYDWASRRIGFATADHSDDGVGEGAVGAPDASSMVAGVLHCCSST